MGLLHLIKQCWDKLKRKDIRIPSRECQICYDVKTYKAFPKKSRIPSSCRACILGQDSLVCKACLVKAIMAKIAIDDPSRVGCPVCPEVWKQWRVQSTIRRGKGGGQRLRTYLTLLSEIFDIVAQYQPPDEETLEMLIQQGSRLCPYCARPFQHVGGCGWMRCGHCVRGFSIGRALLVQDVHAAWLRRSTNLKDGIAASCCE